MRVAFVAIVCLLHSSCALASLGIDLNQDDCRLGTFDFSCLESSGFSFALLQAWNGQNGYTTNLSKCVHDAVRASVDIVGFSAFLCPGCGASASDQVYTFVTKLQKDALSSKQLWFSVIRGCSICWFDTEANCKFVTEAVDQAVTMGVNVGIFSSKYEWNSLVGNCPGLSQLPLWYAHYDDQPTFQDYAQYKFGDWGSPDMKQYSLHGPNKCTSQVSVNYRH